MSKFLLAAFAVGFLTLGLTGCKQADAGSAVSAANTAGDKPLDLTFTAVDGRKVDLADLRGKVVLIDFWATWCPPCRIISPDLVDLYKKYHDQGLEIVGVSVDSDKEALLAMVKKEGLVWPQYFDGLGADNKLAIRFGIEMFPTLWLVDKKGVVISKDFVQNWVTNGGIPPAASPETLAKIDALLEKQLKAP